MRDILSLSQRLLEKAGYDTRLYPESDLDALCFEDDSIMGFVVSFKDAMALVAGWKDAEARLLKRFGGRFRTAVDKSWNVYSILLAATIDSEGSAKEIRLIEEDLSLTRKITAAGIETTDDLRKALLPILPLQHKAHLESGDEEERLRRRVYLISPEAESLLFDSSADPREVARRLAEAV